MPDTRAYHSPRRAESAADTRSDIMAAARTLFAQRGYPKVTVADIAREAHTAVKTVYASAGNKAEILAEILATAVADSGAEATMALVRDTTDLAGAMGVLAHGTRVGNESLSEVVEIMYSAMAVAEVAESVREQGTSLYRASLREVAVHLVQIDALADWVDVARAGDILWFCFGFGAWRTLVKECGWGWADAEVWLRDQAIAMLGRSGR